MIYLDYNATTPVLPEVLEAMMPYLTSEWGNPSSTYKFGSKLKAVIETARAHVAELIGAHAMEIIFTSCATESNNAAIHAALKADPKKKHIITSMVEHSSVLNYCMALERKGYRVTYLPVDREGLLKLVDLENAISDETAVVSLMWANNETGVLFPVKEIGEICRSRGVLFHCDAVQAALTAVATDTWLVIYENGRIKRVRPRLRLGSTETMRHRGVQLSSQYVSVQVAAGRHKGQGTLGSWGPRGAFMQLWRNAQAMAHNKEKHCF